MMPVKYDPPPPDMTLEEQVKHARGFAQGICRNDHHVARLLEQMARSIEALQAEIESTRSRPRWLQYLVCCVWSRRRGLVAPGNWECPRCGTVHLS